jgi:hypothetical protein
LPFVTLFVLPSGCSYPLLSTYCSLAWRRRTIPRPFFLHRTRNTRTSLCGCAPGCRSTCMKCNATSRSFRARSSTFPASRTAAPAVVCGVMHCLCRGLD